jgi:sodium/potassium-transporting ATPase subunit alpha
VKDAGDVSYLEQAMTSGYFFLDTDKYTITECTFPARAMLNDGIASSYTLADPSSYEGLTGGKVVPTEGSIMALVNNDYFPYMPYKARTSPFFKTAWLDAAVNDGNFPGLGGRDSDFTVQMSYQPIGVWGVGVDDATADRTGKVDGVLANYYAEKVYDHRNCFDDMTLTLDTSVEDSTKWSFPALTQVDNDGVVRLNIASRMMQAEALSHGQCSYFVSIVVVQWADLIICKTRMNSLYHQGMSNPLMNFGLLFETILACFFCYWESNFTGALGVRPLRLVHWFPAVPFSCMIVSYDEIRKYMMRKTTIVTIDKGTKQVFRDPKWLERNSYY